MNIIDWLFPPSVLRYDHMYVVSPEHDAIKDMSKRIGSVGDISFHIRPIIKVNGRTFHLAKNDTAMIFSRQRWWTSKPAVTVALLRKSR